jgi:hypothetical protein
MNNVLFRRGDQTFIDENVPLNDGQIIFNETDEAIYVDNTINGSVVRKRYAGGNLSRSDVDSTLSSSSTNPIQNQAVANAISAEISARQTADATLRANIASEASTRVTQDGLLQSQIDQLIAPTGEAPSAAEVQNARVGADGVTYDTLGNAIRGNDNQLINSVTENYKNDLRLTVEELLYQHESLQLDDFDFGYIDATSGTPSDSQKRYYYTRDFVTDVIAINTDFAHFRLGIAVYDLQGNITSFGAYNKTLFFPSTNKKYRLFAFTIDSSGDAFTSHSQIEAVTAFSKMIFVKPTASKLIDKTFGGIQKLFNAINSSKTLPIYAGLKWEYGTLDSDGTIHNNARRLISDKIKCEGMTKITYNGDTTDDSNNDYVVFIGEYNGDTFIRRDTLLNVSNTPIITDYNCTHIRYCFGYSSSQNVFISFDDIKHFSIAAEKYDSILPVVDSSVTWENKNLDPDGSIHSGIITRILSSLIMCTENIHIKFTGAIKNSNDVPFFAAVGIYDKDGLFVRREFLYNVDNNVNYTDVITDENCGYVRFLFGHAAATKEGTEISEASEFSINANNFEITGTHLRGIPYVITSQRTLPSILTIRSKATTSKAKISFNTGLYQSPIYSLGDTTQ